MISRRFVMSMVVMVSLIHFITCVDDKLDNDNNENKSNPLTLEANDELNNIVEKINTPEVPKIMTEEPMQCAQRPSTAELPLRVNNFPPTFT